MDMQIFLLLLSSIYVCKKLCHIFCWVYKKNNSFLSFHFPIFHSKIYKHPGCKIKSDEQGAGRKLEVFSKQTFWVTPKAVWWNWDLYFNLQSNKFSYQLYQFIPFSAMENIFPNSFRNSYSFREWNMSIIYVKFEMWPSSFMWIPHIIFNSEA